MAIPFPGIDPVAIKLGPLSLRWYGLAYLTGLVLGWLYMRRLLRTPHLWRGAAPMKPEQADDFLLWATLGTVIGGRLGFILLYEPSLFFRDPARIFAVWEGGMAFHGGVIGVTLAIILFARINKLPLLSLGDITTAVVPIRAILRKAGEFHQWRGLRPADRRAMGGRVSSLASSMPDDVFGPRHPTQLYEAFLEGIVLFLVIRYFTHSRHSLKEPGFTAGLFLFGYAIARIGVEFFKQWDYEQFFTTAYFSEGMVYSLPMLICGAFLMARAVRRQALPA